jgi:hypothetical protein
MSAKRQPARDKRYWIVEITRSSETVFRKRLAGNLSDGEVATILQRLASRELSPIEVIGASIRKPNQTSLLHVRVDGPPNGKRTMIWIPTFPAYTASRWRESELANYPEILPDEAF